MAVALKVSHKNPFKNAGLFSIQKVDEEVGGAEPRGDKKDEEHSLDGFFDLKRSNLHRYPQPGDGVENGGSKADDRYSLKCLRVQESESWIKYG